MGYKGQWGACNIRALHVHGGVGLEQGGQKYLMYCWGGWASAQQRVKHIVLTSQCAECLENVPMEVWGWRGSRQGERSYKRSDRREKKSCAWGISRVCVIPMKRTYMEDAVL